jgi:CubicO group peptidase (beta-lactamase class C family)
LAQLFTFRQKRHLFQKDRDPFKSITLFYQNRTKMNLSFRLLCAAFSFFPALLPAQGVLDQPAQELGWYSYRDMSDSEYEAKLDELGKKGYRPTDVEILGGTSRKYAAVWRKNADGRGWEVRTKLNDKEFSDKWEEMKNKGYRPVDQEAHNLMSTTYYGAIWVENKENLAWASFRRMSSEEFSKKFDEYKEKYIPVDVDAYEVGGDVLYSVIWVENKDKLAWVEKRNIPQADFGAQFDDYSAKGYRLYSTESYLRNGNQEYATIWVKENQSRRWAARRDMSDTWFHNYWLKYSDLGYRLEDIEVYKTKDGTRYAGVWLENDARVDWKYRDEVEKLVDDYFKKEPTAGMSVAVAVNGKIQLMRGWGFQDVKNQHEAHANTVYRHASVSKALCGTIAFRLKAKNKLDIAKKTRDYEARLPKHHTHTVAQVLSNRGKVRHYKDDDPAASSGTAKVYENAYEASKLFSADPLVAQNYLYSTHGYTLAAAAIEKASGKTYTKTMEDELTNPFDLNTLRCEDLKRNVSERSKIYTPDGSGFKELAPLSLSWKFGGGGTESSAYDLARFGVKLLNGEILSKTDMTAMTTDPDNAANYAYGWDTGTDSGEKVFAKSGGQPGARAYIRCYPDKKIVIALLCNTRGEGVSDLGRAIGALLIK